MNNQSTKVVTGPNTRWSFVHVFKPYDPNGNEANAKYSLCLIIPKDDTQTINAIKEAIKLAYKEGESNLRDCKHPSNYDGSCGYVAGSILLYYWNETKNSRLIGSQYLDANGKLNDTGGTRDIQHNLKDKLVDLAGGDPSSWGKSVRDALIAYCTEVNVSASSTYYLLKIGLDAELAAGRPAIIFGALPKKNGESGLGNHAVVAYGIDKRWWGGYYIVNYGYGSDTAEVDLGFGFVGSVCLFQLL